MSQPRLRWSFWRTFVRGAYVCYFPPQLLHLRFFLGFAFGMKNLLTSVKSLHLKVKADREIAAFGRYSRRTLRWAVTLGCLLPLAVTSR